MKTKGLRIVSLAAEVAPYSKSGGLGDVAKSLPRALQELGHHVTVITPLYGSIAAAEHGLEEFLPKLQVKLDADTTVTVRVLRGQLNGEIPVYFIDFPKLFSRLKNYYGYEYDNQRFYLFSVAALTLMRAIRLQPDLIQCHDWHAGLVPYLVKKRFPKTFGRTATIFTIHNLDFQLGGSWWTVPERFRDSGKNRLPAWNSKLWKYVNFARRGIIYADAINAVSEQYAKEIQTKEFGGALQALLSRREKNLFGIDNGIDYEDYNPATDPGLVANYDLYSLDQKARNKAWLQKKFGLAEHPHTPLIGVVSRLTEQKGFDLLIDVFEPLLRLKIQLFVMGAGSQKYEDFFRMLIRKYPTRVAGWLEFNQDDATKVYAGSDMFLMPSRFEPCGLGQLISLRYGSVPIVRAVGGLASTVTDYNPGNRTGNGFVFQTYDSRDFLVAIARAVEIYKEKELWGELMVSGMQESFSWQVPAKQYERLFRQALRNRRAK
jgi:starch synthase